jgi:hypothetical protein
MRKAHARLIERMRSGSRGNDAGVCQVSPLTLLIDVVNNEDLTAPPCFGLFSGSLHHTLSKIIC